MTGLAGRAQLSNSLLPVVTIQATDASASEPGVPAVIDPGIFTITRSGSTNHAMTVYYAIGGTASNGVDFSAISNSVTIPAGAASARVIINALHDVLTEGTETVVLRLQYPVCVAIYPPPPGCYQPGMPDTAVVSILDNDPPTTNRPPAISILSPTNGASFIAPANILLIASANDPDGSIWNARVEFFAGTNKLGIGQFFDPGSSNTALFHFLWTNVPPGAYVLTARVIDERHATGVSKPVNVVVGPFSPSNHPPVVTIVAIDPIASEGTNCCRWPGWSNSTPAGICVTNTATFIVRRSGNTNVPLSVSYAIAGTASNSLDYATLSGSITIPAGKRSAEIRIVPIDDALPERIETIVLRLIGPSISSNNLPAYVVGTPGRAAAIIVDNDQPRPVTGVLADRCFHIVRPGSNGSCWRIERSADLINWTVLCTNTVSEGALHFVDPDAGAAANYFYRAVPEMNPLLE